jgi:general secretion pathway protein F
MRVSYKAYTAQGKLVQGDIEAPSVSQALAVLRREQNLHPFEATSGKTSSLARQSIWQRDFSLADFSFSGVSLANRAGFLKMLAALLEAGIPLDRALRVLESSKLNTSVSRLASQAAEGVSAGKALSATLEKSGFGAEELGLIRAGEHTGHLAATLAELTQFLEQRIATRSKIASALVYPAVLVVMAIMAMIVVATVLVPTLAPLFEQSGAELPLIVRVMNAARLIVAGYGWWIPVVLCVATIFVFIILRQPASKVFLQRILHLSRIARAQEAARLCRTLGILLRNGVSLQSALRLTSDAARSGLAKQQLQQATERVIAGTRLNKAFENIHVLDKPTLQMIAIGEETNKLDAILLYLATSLDNFATTRIERLTTLLTPVFTILLGGFVGTLIMSVMRAILSLNDLALK